MSFYCLKDDISLVKIKKGSVYEGYEEYKKLVLDASTREYQEIVAFNFYGEVSLDKRFANELAEMLLGNPTNAANVLESRLRPFGRVEHHHLLALEIRMAKAIAIIRGPNWSF